MEAVLTHVLLKQLQHFMSKNLSLPLCIVARYHRHYLYQLLEPAPPHVLL